jgi:hypothetical protein
MRRGAWDSTTIERRGDMSASTGFFERARRARLLWASALLCCAAVGAQELPAGFSTGPVIEDQEELEAEA